MASKTRQRRVVKSSLLTTAVFNSEHNWSKYKYAAILLKQNLIFLSKFELLKSSKSYSGVYYFSVLKSCPAWTNFLNL
jgi:hypothetical protein